MIDPLLLNRVDLEDALLYAVAVSTSDQTATLRIEIDADFHKGMSELGLEIHGETLVDFTFFGVESITIEGLREHPRDWKSDEKPHDYEIAQFDVKKRAFGAGRYLLDLRCQLGQHCKIEFERVALKAAGVPPARMHEYRA